MNLEFVTQAEDLMIYAEDSVMLGQMEACALPSLVQDAATRASRLARASTKDTVRMITLNSTLTEYVQGSKGCLEEGRCKL